MRNFRIVYGDKVVIKNGLLFTVNITSTLVVLFLHVCGWLPNWYYTLIAKIGGISW